MDEPGRVHREYPSLTEAYLVQIGYASEDHDVVS